MFVIVHNNAVILGPIKWHKNSFERVILEECEVVVDLPVRNDQLSPIIVSDTLVILPVQYSPEPTYNSKIEFLHGPFWEFSATQAIASYQVMPMNVDAVKSQLKSKAAEIRWNMENSGVDIMISGSIVHVPTTREFRDTLNKITSPAILKLNQLDWIEVTIPDVTSIMATIDQYIQSCFTWEYNKSIEIDQCNTLVELDAVVL